MGRILYQAKWSWTPPRVPNELLTLHIDMHNTMTNKELLIDGLPSGTSSALELGLPLFWYHSDPCTA